MPRYTRPLCRAVVVLLQTVSTPPGRPWGWMVEWVGSRFATSSVNLIQDTREVFCYSTTTHATLEGPSSVDLIGRVFSWTGYGQEGASLASSGAWPGPLDDPRGQNGQPARESRPARDRKASLDDPPGTLQRVFPGPPSLADLYHALQRETNLIKMSYCHSLTKNYLPACEYNLYNGTI